MVWKMRFMYPALFGETGVVAGDRGMTSPPVQTRLRGAEQSESERETKTLIRAQSTDLAASHS
ncbi:hypothetical protein MSG28_011853 [Choristoneura fumiferana]|uniref:Uncharacterized protein n=1 Tax=Choristoneura fumiferana TaxID=7141 RepID=A0ACC0KMP8_CHOFU|nr:hypothetical protein MSG28_011853 [Choristoneura fumiferana]